MNQMAYRFDAGLPEVADAGDHDASQRESAVCVSLFGNDPAGLSVLSQDAASAGLRVLQRRSLDSLLAEGAGVLGDVVLVDCPQLDAGRIAALMRLDERVTRAGASLVVSTSLDALEDVFGCLDTCDPQILVGASRAQRLVALGTGLAQLSGRRVRELDEEDRTALLRLTEEVARLAAKLEGVGGLDMATRPARPEEERLIVGVAQPTEGFRHAERREGLLRKPRPPLPDPRLIKAIIRKRALRAEYFAGDLFADPAWDILLDLTAARVEHRRVSVTSLCIAARVPPTTALRWIQQMVEAGILDRVQDDSDRRRAFITLSDRSADAMARYFDAVGTDAATI